MRYRITVVAVAALAACNREPLRQPASHAAPAAAESNAANGSLVVSRRVWSGPDFVDASGGPSPDGRYISATDWKTGDLVVRDLAAQQTRRVTNKGSWSDSDEFAEFSVFSRDGKRIAFGWNNGEFYELRLIGADGSGVRTLYRNRELASFVEPHAWSPDDEQILATLGAGDGSVRIALLPVSGGAPRILKSFDWLSPRTMDYSPDGRFIAYDLPTRESPNRRVYTLDLDGGREIRITDGAHNQQLLGWSPDGASLLVLTGDPGAHNITRVPVRNGRRIGEPETVRADAWHVWPIGFSRNAYFYAVLTDHPRAYTLAVDVQAGRLRDEPAVATEAGERGLSPVWSPDGGHLAYIAGPPGRTPRTLVIRSLLTGKARELAPRLQYITRLEWAPDGRSIVVRGRSKGRSGLFQIDLETAKVRSITYEGGSAFALSPDARTVYYASTGNSANGIVAQDLTTGQRRTLPFPRPANDNLAASPDGRSLALAALDEASKTWQLVLAALPNGQQRTLHVLREGFDFAYGAVAWTPDSRHILFVSRWLGSDFPHELYVIPATGGAARRIAPVGQMWHLRMNPDGRRIAFHKGSDASEMWVLENLVGVGRQTTAGQR